VTSIAIVCFGEAMDIPMQREESSAEMDRPDAAIKASVKGLLNHMGLNVKDIPETNAKKTPDFEVDSERADGCLLEVKTKYDDPEEIAAITTELNTGRIVSRSQPTDSWKRVDEILYDGVKQLQEHDPENKWPHFIWLHCEGQDADLYFLRLPATLYGTQKLISSQVSNVITCYYFWDSAFFRHRNSLDGVIISQEGKAQLNLNELSPRLAGVEASSLAKAFKTGTFYPQQYAQDADVMFNDSSGPRKEESVILAYLRTKYQLEHLQTINMTRHSGIVRTPRFEDFKE
jgi:hypothetical protein